MTNEYIYLALYSSALFSLVNIIDKFVLEKYIRHPWIPVYMIGLVGFLVSCVILWWTGIPNISYFTFFLTALSGLLNVLAAYFYIKALMLDDVSKLIPLFFLSPILTLPFAYLLLEETYTYTNLAGIFLLIVGGIAITMNEKFKLVFNKALVFILLSLLCVPAYMSITKFTAKDIGSLEYFAIMRICFLIIIIPLFLHQSKDIISEYRSAGENPFQIMFGNQLINSAGVLLSIMSVNKGKVAIVAALTSLQPLLVLLISYFIYKFFPSVTVDELSKKVLLIRFTAILVLGLGTYLVSV